MEIFWKVLPWALVIILLGWVIILRMAKNDLKGSVNHFMQETDKFAEKASKFKEQRNSIALEYVCQMLGTEKVKFVSIRPQRVPGFTFIEKNGLIGYVASGLNEKEIMFLTHVSFMLGEEIKTDGEGNYELPLGTLAIVEDSKSKFS